MRGRPAGLYVSSVQSCGHPPLRRDGVIPNAADNAPSIAPAMSIESVPARNVITICRRFIFNAMLQTAKITTFKTSEKITPFRPSNIIASAVKIYEPPMVELPRHQSDPDLYAPYAPPAASVRTITMKFSISFIFRPRHSVWKPDDASPVESSISL